MYMSKLEALLEYHGSGYAIHEVIMKQCPTKAEYNALRADDEGDMKKAHLFHQSKQVCAIMVIRKETNHGLAMINKTKMDDHPYELVW